MPEPSQPIFAQPARRSLLLPVLVAIAALGIAGVLAIHFFPATTVNIDHVHVDLLDTHTVFKNKSIVIAAEQAQDVLFVAETLKVDNQLRELIYLDDFSLTLTNPDGAQLTVKAMQKSDLPNLQLSFPALTPLLAAPLLRDTSINPGKSAQGTVVFSLPVPKATWAARKSAVVQVDLYHQTSLYLTIP